MNRRIIFSTFVCWLLAGTGRADDPFFELKIRPLLAGTCFKCHGGERTSGKLRVDSRAALLKGGESGPAVVPGQPEKSLLVTALRYGDGAPHMPPDKPLPSVVVADFVTWIKDGAIWPAPATIGEPVKRHWAFEPVLASKPPAGQAPNPIDRFVAAKWPAATLKPAERADKRTLIRRAAFDLTGLPPSPAEVDAFLNDGAPDAYARLVERLLASPHYGEKWGRHWLDVVRYADTAGETADFPAPHAWRYRNYVIDAFNRDLPYDQFLREQLAGDLLAKIAPAGRRAELVNATGFLAVSRRFGYDILHDHYLTIDDTLDTLGKSVLGLALGCARCHDHKYDPVSAADYYALFGILESTRYPFPGCEKTKAPRDLVPLADHELSYAVAEGEPHDAQIHLRGDPETRGHAVPRRNLMLLGGHTLPPGSGSGRLELAGWLTQHDNPLTARVMANRVWQHHFGAGLVRTPNDFGTRGEPPSHPELLDWLAAGFMADGWSVKNLHRRIMLSEAYQRSSRIESPADPANVLLGRFTRRRLTAEEIRDTMLAVGGDLDSTPGGPHPFPPENSWGFTQHAPFTAVYDHNHRSVYLMTQRLKRHPLLALFDGPDTGASTGQRHTTTVPTQALFFLNDPFVHVRAARLAGRLLPLKDDRARTDSAFRQLFGRPPSEAEQQSAARFRAEYAAGRAEPANVSWAAWLRVLLCSNEFLYVD